MKPLKASDVVGRYVPTKNERLRIIKKDGCFKLSGDGVFHTIQGEGKSIGEPATFVRLHFCNLKCSWCDTWYTWHTKTKEYYQEPFDVPIDDLQELIVVAQKEKGVKTPVHNIVFTGGEPLLQQSEIVKFMKMCPHYNCEIETNGTIIPSKELLKLVESGRVKFNCSPKLKSANNKQDLSSWEESIKIIASYETTTFKFVCQTRGDIDFILEKYKDLIPHNQIVIMPEGVTKEENSRVYEEIIDKIIKHNLRTCPRLQNICFDGSKRGV